MRIPLDDELDAICKLYDYGIVPGSVTVFVRDKVKQCGQLDLTLLEGIMIVVDVSEEGFMVTSCTQIINEPKYVEALKVVQVHLEHVFDSMEKLLMTISPLFAAKYIERLQSSVHHDFLDTTCSIQPPSSILSSEQQQEQQQLQQQQSVSNISSAYSDVFDWIH
ncbi:uncharacterized protein BX664DRAFT_331362 [Halteromyces radiatus]|uniref:uncharacterized protein n=1 Tax=Halteromyces radiatus TaxID=101107 RepID=UPI0022205380|nr:uncharacterized protein BX664DRAFT_331362 [Halteromyces radiatus]KAI8088781.1 hypothetical protein BX664DRAFT_331362 [Halteromyces radiatus]